MGSSSGVLGRGRRPLPGVDIGADSRDRVELQVAVGRVPSTSLGRVDGALPRGVSGNRHSPRPGRAAPSRGGERPTPAGVASRRNPEARWEVLSPTLTDRHRASGRRWAPVRADVWLAGALAVGSVVWTLS